MDLALGIDAGEREEVHLGGGRVIQILKHKSNTTTNGFEMLAYIQPIHPNIAIGT